MDSILSEKIKEVLLSWSEKQVNNAKSILQNDSKVAKGILLNSLMAELVGDDTINIKYASYGKFVSEGRSTGKFPNISDIEDWCKIKGIDLKAVYPIARSIAANGIAGDGWIDDIMDKVNELAEMLSTAIGKEITLSIKESLEKKE